MMTYLKVYNDYFEVLVKILPMKDAYFIAALYSNNLLPDEVSEHIDSLPTKGEKAKYFLQNVIKPSLDANATENFDKFLLIMEKSEYNVLNKKAAEMKLKLTAKQPKRKRDESSDPESDNDAKQPKHKKRDESSDPESGYDGNNLGCGDEVLHSTKDGKGWLTMTALEEAKHAICIVDGPDIVNGGSGTGFVGKIIINDSESLVLVTCCHVMIDGISNHDIYHATTITEHMKKEIEEYAKKFKIKVNSRSIRLRDILVENSSIISPRLLLDYFIIEIDEEKLKHQWKNFVAIDLNNPANVRNDNQIYILQHPSASAEPKMSSSSCRIVESGGNVLHYMVYKAGTDEGSSGSPILKQDGEKMVIAGLHRGGKEKNWDGKGAEGYNFGSLFTEIYASIRNGLHPSAAGPHANQIRQAVQRLK